MRGCGPPASFRLPSPCPWVAHPVSGLVPAIINALFGLAFALAPGFDSLSRPQTTNSLAHYAKGTRSPHKAAPILWTHEISETISSPFRGAFHLSLAVLFTIDLQNYLALEGGPPRFKPDFTCPTLLRILSRKFTFRRRGSHPLWPPVPGSFAYINFIDYRVLQPPTIK